MANVYRLDYALKVLNSTSQITMGHPSAGAGGGGGVFQSFQEKNFFLNIFLEN